MSSYIRRELESLRRVVFVSSDTVHVFMKHPVCPSVRSSKHLECIGFYYAWKLIFCETFINKYVIIIIIIIIIRKSI